MFRGSVSVGVEHGECIVVQYGEGGFQIDECIAVEFALVLRMANAQWLGVVWR